MSDEIMERFDCKACDWWNINCTCNKVCESGSQFKIKRQKIPSDKIRGSFEEEYSNDDMDFCWSEEDGSYKNIHTAYAFGDFERGYKSRDEEVQRLEAELKIQQEAMAEQLKYRKEDADKIFELDGLVDMLTHEKDELQAEVTKWKRKNHKHLRSNINLKAENKKLREELGKEDPVKCPDCNTAMEMFDADNDWCPICKIYKPAGEYAKQADGE